MQLDLFPLNTVLFPGMRLPLHIFEPRYLEMIAECVKSDRVFGVVLIADGEEVGEAATPCGTGTTARVIKIDQQPDGQLDIVVVGESRFHIDSIISREPRVVAEVELAPLRGAGAPTGLALAMGGDRQRADRGAGRGAGLRGGAGAAHRRHRR